MTFAPRDVFEQILEWSVIPTFDLVLHVDGQGFVLVRRRIAPYKGVWALPGLRMFKGESIDQALTRISTAEVGLDIDPGQRRFLGQYVGRFRTEHQRQDLSTGYLITLPAGSEPTPNPEHFSSSRLSYDDVEPMGAMYRFYLGAARDLLGR